MDFANTNRPESQKSHLSTILSRALFQAWATLWGSFMFLLPLHPVFAQVQFQDPLKGRGPIAIIAAIINFLLGLIAVVALLALVWGAFLMVSSAGNESTLHTAKRIVFWSIVGLTVTLLSFVAVRLIFDVVGA